MKKNLTYLSIGAVVMTILYLGLEEKSELMQKNETKVKAIEQLVGKKEHKLDNRLVLDLDIRRELEAKQDLLPTLNDLGRLTEEEVHHTPEIVLQGGKIIYETLEEAENHPERREETLAFFFDCSSNQDLAPAIRAMCWNKAVKAVSRWDIFIPISEYNVPNEIKLLAEKID